MKKLILGFICALAAIAGAGYVSAENTYYKVGPFDKLSVRGNINVVYSCVPDSSGYARYDDAGCPEEPFELSTSKGKLFVKWAKEESRPAVMPTLYVYSDYLTAVENEGDSTLNVKLSARVPTFSAKLIGNGRVIVDNVNATNVKASIPTGNGSIILDGRCSKADFNIVGAGTIQADGLYAEKVNCKGLGTGTIGCWPEESLDVRGIGTTKIYYKGAPELKVVGGAKAIRLDDAAD